jgi:glutamate-1-semialdehyde 2,1-aminomutase
VRSLCTDNDILLIFDEVVTGFRLARGGAQEYYGVIPDLVAYGKALGGGYPIGAFGGRTEIMEMVNEQRIGRDDYVWMASTLGGNPISCAAALAALSVYRQPGTYERLHAMGETLRSGMADILAARQITGQIIGDGPLAQVVFSDTPAINYRGTHKGDKKLGRATMLALFRKAVFLNPMGTKLYLSIAHDEVVIGEFLERFDEALGEATASV